MITSFERIEGLIVVPVLIIGPLGRAIAKLALDTGATSSVMHEQLLTPLGYQPSLRGGFTRIVTVSGSELAPQVKLQRVYSQASSVET